MEEFKTVIEKKRNPTCRLSLVNEDAIGLAPRGDGWGEGKGINKGNKQPHAVMTTIYIPR